MVEPVIVTEPRSPRKIPPPSPLALLSEFAVLLEMVELVTVKNVPSLFGE
jgi:hypothetical protein